MFAIAFDLVVSENMANLFRAIDTLRKLEWFAPFMLSNGRLSLLS